MTIEQIDELDIEANEIRLVGRVSGCPQSRTLPSGDEVVVWRLVVRRPRPRPGGATVDTIDCATWQRRMQRRVSHCGPGDVLECNGSLRRHFWRGPGGPVSRYEVEVRKLRKV